MCKSVLYWLLRCPWLLGGALLVAVSALADGLESQRQLLQLEQAQRRLLEAQRAQRRPAVEAEQPEQAAGAVAPSGRCWAVNGLQLTGTRLITPATFNSHLQPLLKPCMGVAEIDQLLLAITGLYVEAGYLLARPGLAALPVAGQSLHIEVQEGFVESVQWQPGVAGLSLAGAFPGMLGKPLLLADLEQGLDQLNRLRSVQVTAELLPGEREQGSQVLLQQRSELRPWQVSATLDNQGSASTGRERAQLSLSLDDPLGLNDFLYLGLSDTLNRSARFSRNQSLYYHLPYGYWSLSLFAADAQYRAAIPQLRNLGDRSGTARQASVRLDRVLWRNQSLVSMAHLQLGHKRIDNFFLDQRVQLQSPTLSVAQVGASLLWNGPSVTSLDLSYSRGLTWLGADRGRGGGFAEGPQAQFAKYQLDLSHWRNGQWFGQFWQWHGQGSLQYSNDLLPAVEQSLLTDESAVRGFRLNTASGDSAVLWRNTLSVPLGNHGAWSVTPRLGLDAGWLPRADERTAQWLAGSSLGVLLGNQTLSLELDYQRALRRAEGFEAEPGFWLMRLKLVI